MCFEHAFKDPIMDVFQTSLLGSSSQRMSYLEECGSFEVCGKRVRTRNAPRACQFGVSL
jgi:hypothetical protein